MALFSRSSSGSSCPEEPSGPQYGYKHVVGDMTFHDLTFYLSGGFAVIACVISGVAIMRHALHFSKPAEQTKILRIIALIPAYAILSFFAAFIPEAATYLMPWTDAYESVALASFFVLLVTYVAPVPETREAFFSRLEMKAKKGQVKPGGSLRWYHHTWFFVFQYIPVSWIVAVGTDVSQAAGTYCAASSSLHYSHIWFLAIKSVSVALAFLRILSFYQRLKPEFKEHKAFSKLLAIKGIVGLSAVQNIIFSILHSTKVLKPNATLSYDDITFGLPNLILCAEMVLFAAFHLYAFNVGPFKTGRGFAMEAQTQQKFHYLGGPFGIKALAAAANPMDIFQGLVTAVAFMTGRVPMQQRSQDVGIEFLRSSEYSSPYIVHDTPPSYEYQQPSGIQRAHSPNRQEVTRDRSPSPQEYGERWVRGREEVDGRYDPLAIDRF